MAAPAGCRFLSVDRRRWLQTVILLVGLVGLVFAITRTVDEASEQVMPSAGALVVAGGLGLVAIVTSGRAWVALFDDVVVGRGERLRFVGTYYLSQLTKYLPGGGVVQAVSQVGLAASFHVPLRRVAVAFPVSAAGAVAAGCTLGAGLAVSGSVAGWVRVLAIAGLASLALLHRRVLATALKVARKVVKRIPKPDALPSQRSILVFYGWALLSVGASAAAYTVLLRSLSNEVSPALVFCAAALSWAVGFLLIPIPAGIGVREAMLVAVVPTVSTAPLLAASLAQRLLAIGADVGALVVNRVAQRVRPAGPPASGRLDERVADPPAEVAPQPEHTEHELGWPPDQGRVSREPDIRRGDARREPDDPESGALADSPDLDR
jgi:hypothetical protein